MNNIKKPTHRKVSRVSQGLINIIHRTARLVNIQDIEYDILYFDTELTDSLLSDVHKVIIKGHRDGQRIQCTYIVKWNSQPRRCINYRNSYNREYAFYYYIVPKLLEIQKHFKVIEGLKMTFSNCIDFSIECDKEYIVLSAMSTNYRYRIRNRFCVADFEHCSFVMKELAKLHALFFVLKNTDRIDFEKINKIYEDNAQYSDTESASHSMTSFYNSSVNLINDPASKSKLKKIAPDILKILRKCVVPNITYTTICHGDCWNSNIIYKYQGKKPVNVLLIDYQLSRCASPVTDISYYLYMSADEQFLSEHYDRMIYLYYKTLGAVLRQCNQDVEIIYPYQVFQQHLLEYSVFGLIEALISMKIITAQSEDAVRMTEMRYEESDEVIENQIYIHRVNGVVNDFFTRNYSLEAVLNNSI